MTDYITLTEFVPGTKAKAQEVNANFSTLKAAINSKAPLNGDASTTFLVSDATQAKEAINKSQLEETKNEIEKEIKGLLNRFCIISGNTSGSESDLVSFSGTTLSFKIGSSYPSLVWIGANGVVETIEQLPEITGLSTNGNYTVIKEFDTPNAIATSSKVTSGKSFPTTSSDGDYHYLTLKTPQTFKKISGSWVETQYIQLATVTVTSQTISSVTSAKFLQNGYDLNINSTIKSGSDFAMSSTNLSMPNYSLGVNKSWATSYLAECDGWLFAACGFSLFLDISFDGTNWTTLTLFNNGGQGQGAGTFRPIPKGLYYRARNDYGGQAWKQLIFYPTKGAN